MFPKLAIQLQGPRRIRETAWQPRLSIIDFSTRRISRRTAVDEASRRRVTLPFRREADGSVSHSADRHRYSVRPSITMSEVTGSRRVNIAAAV